MERRGVVELGRRSRIIIVGGEEGVGLGMCFCVDNTLWGVRVMEHWGEATRVYEREGGRGRERESEWTTGYLRSTQRHNIRFAVAGQWSSRELTKQLLRAEANCGA